MGDAAEGDNGVRALLLNLFEDAGVSVATTEERQAFQGRLTGVGERHQCTWTEAQKIKRHYERGSLAAHLSNPATWKTLPIPHLLSAFATFPTGEGENEGPILTAAQVNRAICGLLELATGDFNYLEVADGMNKVEAANVWWRALSNCAITPATVNITQRNKWSLILKVGMNTEIRNVANLARVEKSFKIQLADAEAAAASKRRKVEDKSFVCLRWMKNECSGGCSDLHRVNKGTADFLNKKFALGLSPEAIAKKVGGK